MVNPSRAEIERAIDEAIIRRQKEQAMSDPNVGELQAEIAGQKLTMKNAPLNTVATIATLIISTLIGYSLYQHQQDAKEVGQNFSAAVKEMTNAVKDQTVAQREQNCLMRFDPKDRQGQVDFCKTIAR